MRKTRIALCGPMGAGKSTVGRRLAAALRLPFVDTDDLVCATSGTSIATLVEQHGESHFRSIERAACLAALADPEGGVVALGGGAVTIDDVAERLAAPDVATVYLSARPATSAARAAGDRHNVRPLLASGDADRTLARLLDERRERYERADVHVVTDERTVDEIVGDVLAALGDG